ncbi:FlgD immunoglobulin-like domain containing protein [Micromonospora sp. URMC 105]|uniref:FlgD immunoglobulin-like domain containing protein n=1 Tax=Micromonospora sp. URMC 105 TaxID=3423413 RepID=UPI003F1D06F0
MSRRTLVRVGIAGAMSVMLGVGLVPLTTGAAQGEPSSGEVVIPPTTVLRPHTSLLSAGPSGFLRYEHARGHLWTSYAGADTVVDASATGIRTVPDFGAGSDVVAHYDDNDRTVRLRDMSTGRSRTVVLPAAHTYVSTLGWTVVTTTGSFGGADVTWQLLDTRDDNSFTQRAVQGVPDGVLATFEADSPLGDAHGQVVQYRTAAGGGTGWLDVDQGRLIPLPYRVDANPGRIVLTPTHLLWWQDGVVFVHSRQNLSATPRTVPLTGEAQLLGMVGETLVVSRYDSSLGRLSYLLPVWRVEVVALDGSTVKTLLARSAQRALPTPNGGLLVPGGSGPGWDGWGVSLVEAAADGQVTARRIADAYPQRMPVRVDDLTLTQGRLTTQEHDLAIEQRHLYTRDIGVAGSPTVGARVARGATYEGCAGGLCTELHDTGDGRTVVSGVDGSLQPHLLEPTQSLPGSRIDSSRTYQSVVAASGRFAALAATPDTGAVTRIIDLGTRRTVFTTTAGVRAMWGTTLWVQDGNDAVTPVDALTGQRGAQVWFGRGCLLEDFQAVGRWLLWTCVGSMEGQGVYDTVTKKNLTLVSGSGWSRAKLGDGFVVSEADGQLKVTDMRSGSPVSHTAGDFSSGLWDVDPYTGLIAHAGADGAVHLVTSGIPVSPLVQLDASVAGSVDVKGGAAQWSPKWWLSKPAASWTLVIKNKATGAAVRTLSGGLARGLVAAAWNGKDGSGRLMPNTAYTWTLTAQPADGQGAALTRSGTVLLARQCLSQTRWRSTTVTCSSYRSAPR